MEKTIARNHNPNGTQSLFEAITRPTFSNVVGFIVLAFLAMVLMAPVSAMAQSGGSSSGQFTFAPDSYFINVILQGILGTAIKPSGNAQTAGQVISATGTNTLGEVFRTFNTGVAFFGSVMIVFTTIVGILQSGNDGEFLGRKWSSMWVPIRFATGSALMLPLTSSGYSYCQAMVLWIAGQGVGFADTLWNTIVAKLIVKDGMVLTKGIDLLPVVRSMAMAELCTAIINDRNRLAGANLTPIARTKNTFEKANTNTFVMNWQRAGSNPSSEKIATCGSVFYAATDINVIAMTGGQNRSTDPYMYVREAMFEFHKENLPLLADKFKGNAGKIALRYGATTAGSAADAFDPTDLLKEMEALARQETTIYKDKMGVKVTEALKASGYKTQGNSGNSGILATNQVNPTTEMTRYGFAMAGMWYMELLKAHSTARHALEPPVAGAPNLDSLRSDPGFANFSTIYADASQMISSLPVASAAGFDSKTEEQAFGSAATIKTTTTSFTIDTDAIIEQGIVSGFMAGLMDWLREAVFGVGQTSGAQGSQAAFGAGKTNTVTNIFGSKARDPNVSVILQLKDKGDTILNVTSLIMALDIAAKVKSGFTKAGEDGSTVAKVADKTFNFFSVVGAVAAAIIEKLSGYLIGAAVALFLFGVMLSVYVPMLPYILWVGALLGLVILILESMVAIMLWAVMMMHPSGEGITSDYNRQGMNMLLAVFTRPALLLMGMVLGMFMVEPMVMFINDTFYVMMKTVQSNTFTGIFQGIAFIAIYVSLIMMVVEKSFSLIHVIPDRVLTWIGGPGALTGEEREITGRAQGMISGAGGAASTVMLGKGMNRGNPPGKESPGEPKAEPGKQWIGKDGLTKSPKN